MRTMVVLLAVTGSCLLGCAKLSRQAAADDNSQTPGNYRATWKSEPELQDVMDAMVEVNAEALWNAAIDDKAPKSVDDWEALDHAAVALAETGKFLKISDLAKKNP